MTCSGSLEVKAPGLLFASWEQRFFQLNGNKIWVLAKHDDAVAQTQFRVDSFTDVPERSGRARAHRVELHGGGGSGRTVACVAVRAPTLLGVALPSAQAKAALLEALLAFAGITARPLTAHPRFGHLGGRAAPRVEEDNAAAGDDGAAVDAAVGALPPAVEGARDEGKWGQEEEETAVNVSAVASATRTALAMHDAKQCVDAAEAAAASASPATAVAREDEGAEAAAGTRAAAASTEVDVAAVAKLLRTTLAVADATEVCTEVQSVTDEAAKPGKPETAKAKEEEAAVAVENVAAVAKRGTGAAAAGRGGGSANAKASSKRGAESAATGRKTPSTKLKAAVQKLSYASALAKGSGRENGAPAAVTTTTATAAETDAPHKPAATPPSPTSTRAAGKGSGTRSPQKGGRGRGKGGNGNGRGSPNRRRGKQGKGSNNSNSKTGRGGGASARSDQR